MKRVAPVMLLAVTFAVTVACADGSPISGEYCAPTEATKCTTISFPAKRGTDTLGTLQLDARRYELRWMDTEAGGRRTYIANLPGGTIAFDMTAVDSRTVIVRWRDKRPEQTYALK